MYNITHYENHNHFAKRNTDPRALLVQRMDATQTHATPMRSFVNMLNKLRGNR